MYLGSLNNRALRQILAALLSIPIIVGRGSRIKDSRLLCLANYDYIISSVNLHLKSSLRRGLSQS
jgi:hypothetical protein